MTNNKGLTKANIVMPAVSPEEAVKAWEEYLALKEKIAKPEDKQVIQGKEFYKKSYWRKLATFFNLSVEVVEERQESLADGNIVFHFTCKAIAPNGRYAIGAGTCDLMEKGYKNTIHNARSTAETRAFNRSVSNLVGGGEVSAEELENGQENSNKCKYCGTIGKYHKKGCPAITKSATGSDVEKIAEELPA